MHLSIFAQGGVATDLPPIDREGPVRGEALCPPLGVLGVNRVTRPRTELLDSQFLDPCVFHNPLLGSDSGRYRGGRERLALDQGLFSTLCYNSSGRGGQVLFSGLCVL